VASRNLGILQKQVWRKIDLIEDRFERRLASNYRTALDEIRIALSKVYEKYAKAGKLTHAEMSKYNRLTSLERQLAEILGPELGRNGRLLDKLATVQYEESFYRHAWALDQHTGVALKWGLLNPKQVEAAVKAGGWRELHDIAVKTWRGDTLAKLDRTITQGLIQGQSYPKMARAMKHNVLESSMSNALRIARTEGQRAAVQGQIANADKADALGVKVRRIWDATLDRRTRPEHGALDGQAADEDGMFDTSVGLIPGPLQSGVASFDISCRCRIREEVEGYEPKVRRIRDEGVQPYETYDTWAMRHGIRSYEKYLINRGGTKK